MSGDSIGKPYPKGSFLCSSDRACRRQRVEAIPVSRTSDAEGMLSGFSWPPRRRVGHSHKVALGRFLDDGVIPIDNGIVERLHVCAALTRKHYLFAGPDAGGERAAIAYTILGCCRLADVNPVEYLADILPRFARGLRLRDVPAMLPGASKAARQAVGPSDARAAAPGS